MSPRVEALAVGRPRLVDYRGGPISTSIFKRPIAGPVMVRRHNLDGDQQSDLSAHGGEYKAVYAYAAEHYEWWTGRLGRELEPAHFGENVTTVGLDEADVAIGDVFRVGDAELEATEPRLPCFKLGIRFGDPGMVKAFAASGRFGVYFRVVSEGRIRVGDTFERLRRPDTVVPVPELARLYLRDHGDMAGIRRVLSVAHLDPSWRGYFEKRLPAVEG